MTHNVFICYRRLGGNHLADHVKDALESRGYSVFMDVYDLGRGEFDTNLLKKIEEVTDFLVILTKGSLDRCGDECDWLRTEIRHAIKCDRNIVPFMEHGFQMPPADLLPKDIAKLVKYQGIDHDSGRFKDDVNKLAEKFLKSQPRTGSNEIPDLPESKTDKRLHGRLLGVLAVVFICIVSVISYVVWQNSQDTATAELIQQVQTDPNDVQAVSKLVDKYLRNQESAQADAVLDGVAANPDASSQTIAKIANYYSQRRAWNKLEQTLHRLTEVSSNNPEAWYDLARVRAMQGNATEARPALLQALELNAQRPATNANRRLLLEKSLSDAAFADLLKEPDFTNLTSLRSPQASQ